MKRVIIYTNKITRKVAEGVELEYLMSIKNPATAACDKACNDLRKFIADNGGTLPNGLVTEQVRKHPEYSKFNSAFDKAFANERNVNKWVNQMYKASVIYVKK